MKRSSKNISSSVEENPKRLEMHFTSTEPEETEKPSYPENDGEFWSDTAVRSCGPTLLVRKYSANNNDTIFLRRLNQKRDPTNFHFPATLIPAFLGRIDKLLQRLEKKPNGQYQISGINDITTDFSKERFWDNSEEAFKISSLWVQPYLSKFGIQIRLLSRLENGEYREFVDKNGKEIKWYGPSNSISPKCLQLLREVLLFYQQEAQNSEG